MLVIALVVAFFFVSALNISAFAMDGEQGTGAADSAANTELNVEAVRFGKCGAVRFGKCGAVRFGKRGTIRFGKRGTIRFGKRGTVRFGKRGTVRGTDKNAGCYPRRSTGGDEPAGKGRALEPELYGNL